MNEEMKRKRIISKNGKEDVTKTAFTGNRSNKFQFNCYNCGKKGHKRSDCKFKRKGTWKENQANVGEKEGSEESEIVAS